MKLLIVCVLVLRWSVYCLGHSYSCANTFDITWVMGEKYLYWDYFKNDIFRKLWEESTEFPTTAERENYLLNSFCCNAFQSTLKNMGVELIDCAMTLATFPGSNDKTALESITTGIFNNNNEFRVFIFGLKQRYGSLEPEQGFEWTDTWTAVDPTWWGQNSLIDNLALDDLSNTANFGCFDAEVMQLKDCSVLDTVYPLCAIPLSYCKSITQIDTGAQTTCPLGQAPGDQGCQSCVAGSYSAFDTKECISCAAGTYSNSGASICTSCSANTYSEDESSQCIACADYTVTTDHLSCSAPDSSGTCLVENYVVVSNKLYFLVQLGQPVDYYTARDACNNYFSKSLSFMAYFGVEIPVEVLSLMDTYDISQTWVGAYRDNKTITGFYWKYDSTAVASTLWSELDFNDWSRNCVVLSLSEKGLKNIYCINDEKPPDSVICMTSDLRVCPHLQCSSGESISADVSNAQCASLCPAGQEIASQTCSDCSAGKFSKGSTISCLDCLPGKYSDLQAATKCSDCQAGTQKSSNGLACESCVSGRYSNNGASCLACQPGRYGATAGASECFQCQSGKFTSTSGLSACESCAEGKYSNGTWCVLCPPGRYNYQKSMSSCDQCEAGKFSSAFGSQDCAACVGSSYSENGASTCTSCGSGTYLFKSSIVCLNCSLGRFAERAMIKDCAGCAAGKYSDTEGSSMCKVCPGDSTSASNAENIHQCFCPAGKYGSPQKAQNCTNCIDSPGVLCTANSSHPTVKQGYFWNPQYGTEVFQCVPAEACPQVEGVVSLNGTVCAALYTGFMCGECVKLEAYRHNGGCSKCPGEVAKIFTVIALIVSFSFLCYRFAGSVSSIPQDVKMAFSAIQIIALYPGSFTGWPASMQPLFTVFSFFVKLSSYFCCW